MRFGPEFLLLSAVVSVGVLHTLVPDHWLPIAALARQQRWARARTARAAAIAGLGHTISTLAIGVVVWVAGVALALRLGNLVALLSSIALIGFGLWMAIASLLEIHRNRERADDSVEAAGSSRRTALLLILGSSPMVEGIPAFFAASRFGAPLLAVMAVCFALSTISTYVLLCVYSHAAFKAVALGPLERYGEVLSGGVIAVVGSIFLFWAPL